MAKKTTNNNNNKNSNNGGKQDKKQQGDKILKKATGPKNNKIEKKNDAKLAKSSGNNAYKKSLANIVDAILSSDSKPSKKEPISNAKKGNSNNNSATTKQNAKSQVEAQPKKQEMIAKNAKTKQTTNEIDMLFETTKELKKQQPPPAKNGNNNSEAKKKKKNKNKKKSGDDNGAAKDGYVIGDDNTVYDKRTAEALFEDDFANMKGDLKIGGKQKRKRIDGLPIYTEEELKIGKGGGTPLCPFDCDCCF